MSFKKYFVASSDYTFINMDFSQLEVCALAEYTDDPVLIKELNSGVDIHRSNAAEWLNKLQSEVTPKERKDAKVMTFQLQYGAGRKKIAETLGISEREAAAFIDMFYTKYHKIYQWHLWLATQKKAFEGKGWLVLTDPCNRRYRIFEKQDKNDPTKTYFSLPEMKNYPIQGFATGGIVPLVVTMLGYAIGDNSSIKMLNTVHDSVLFEVQNAHVIQTLMYIEDVFKEFPKRFQELFDKELKVIYNYDIEIGTDWDDMDKYTRKQIQDLLNSNEV